MKVIALLVVTEVLAVLVALLLLLSLLGTSERGGPREKERNTAIELAEVELGVKQLLPIDGDWC